MTHLALLWCVFHLAAIVVIVGGFGLLRYLGWIKRTIDWISGAEGGCSLAHDWKAVERIGFEATINVHLHRVDGSTVIKQTEKRVCSVVDITCTKCFETRRCTPIGAVMDYGASPTDDDVAFRNVGERKAHQLLLEVEEETNGEPT